ncbi:amidohydrolase family protein [Jiangella anatolica]|uniref:Metal-dependent hydrolase n=1 Tax=Jiangella anatolica TaxID=2670374 RepID=A0A2W2C9A6_9ACTN|nr:amidohydrolase family protein [Jiangella anatolica]PZF82396.1 metal-dependent hydrolase [Jiangella anatolica]
MTLIDAHQHFWDPAAVAYPWMDPADAVIHRRYGPEHLAPHLERHGIDGTVLVQSADSDEDADAMFAVAAAFPPVLGIVGYVPLEDPARAAERLAQLSERPGLVGIRTLIHDRPDPDWLLRPSVVDGLRLLEQADLPFDLVAVLPRHLEVLLELAERLPGLRVVIDHLAKPPFSGSGSGDAERWRDLLTAVAAHPGVYAKVSGLYPPPGTDLRPWVDHAMEAFGPERLMLGSDWPIAERAGGFDPVWSALVEVVDGYGPQVAAQLRSETARRFYRLPDPPRASQAAAQRGAR